MAIDIRNGRDGPILHSISHSEWQTIEPLIADLLDQWGDFIGPYDSGKLTDFHCKAIARRIDDAPDISEATKSFFASYRNTTLDLYTQSD